MATTKSFTDVSQSKKLAEILPLESADMYYREWKRMTKDIRIANVGSAGEKDLPCWSLSALLGVLPKKYTELIKEGGMYRIIIKDSYMTCLFDNPIDACYYMIIHLHELKML